MRGKFANRWLDALAPCRCSLCLMPSGRDIELCVPCEGELPWLVKCCRQCALPLESAGTLCARCLQKPPAFDRCIAACTYTEPVSGWVHAAKYRGDFASLHILRHLLGRAVRAALDAEPPPDLLVAMPLHWRRRWWRGFNQAEALGQSLAGLQPAGGIARRIRATAPQRQLDAVDRRRNLDGAFRVSRDVAGCSVAVVDDVVTTGASAEVLSRALKAAGARKVSIWCCARTPSVQ